MSTGAFDIGCLMMEDNIICLPFRLNLDGLAYMRGNRVLPFQHYFGLVGSLNGRYCSFWKKKRVGARTLGRAQNDITERHSKSIKDLRFAQAD